MLDLYPADEFLPDGNRGLPYPDPPANCGDDRNNVRVDLPGKFCRIPGTGSHVPVDLFDNVIQDLFFRTRNPVISCEPGGKKKG